jgi:hypothetical protein
MMAAELRVLLMFLNPTFVDGCGGVLCFQYPLFFDAFPFLLALTCLLFSFLSPVLVGTLPLLIQNLPFPWFRKDVFQKALDVGPKCLHNHSYAEYPH